MSGMAFLHTRTCSAHFSAHFGAQPVTARTATEGCTPRRHQPHLCISACSLARAKKIPPCVPALSARAAHSVSKAERLGALGLERSHGPAQSDHLSLGCSLKRPGRRESGEGRTAVCERHRGRLPHGIQLRLCRVELAALG